MTVRFLLPLKDMTSISIYDMSGRMMQSIAHGIFESGEHQLDWYADNLSSGIYFIRMSSGDFMDTKKITLIK